MRIAAIALVAAAALVLTGCTPGAHPSATSSPKATPVFRSDAQALAAAEKAYGAYEAAVDRALQQADDEGLSKVAAGEALKAAKKSVDSLKDSGRHDEGSSQIRQVRPADVSGLLKAKPRPGQIYACLDVSGVSVVDRHGQVVPTQAAKTVYPMIVTLDVFSGSTLKVTDESVWDGSDFCA